MKFKKQKRKTPKSERQKQKDRTWKYCSKYIRLRDCLATTGTTDFGVCCTCGRTKHIKELDAGHYISGRSNSVLFNDKGIHIQCRKCNRFEEGNKGEYEKFMLEKYGAEECERQKNAKHLSVSLSLFELKALELDYKQKLKTLKGE